jgi:hypothetical protein
MSCLDANVGIASYMNVAMTDPLSQTGLLAYDDEELRQAIPTREIFVSKVSDAEDAEPHDNLFVVAFSRNCSGMRGNLQPQPAGLASSSMGRNSRAEGPKFRKLWKGLRPADRDFEAKTGGLSTDSPANMHLPAPGGPLGGQLVEIGQGPSTSWSKSPRGACEPCYTLICWYHTIPFYFNGLYIIM